MNAYATAHQTFPYVYQYKYFILGAKHEQQVNLKSLTTNLCLLREPVIKAKVFKTKEECLNAAKVINQNKLIPYNYIKFRSQDLEIITDDNMITEFKYGIGI